MQQRPLWLLPPWKPKRKTFPLYPHLQSSAVYLFHIAQNPLHISVSRQNQERLIEHILYPSELHGVIDGPCRICQIERFFDAEELPLVRVVFNRPCVPALIDRHPRACAHWYAVHVVIEKGVILEETREQLPERHLVFRVEVERLLLNVDTLDFAQGVELVRVQLVQAREHRGCYAT